MTNQVYNYSHLRIRCPRVELQSFEVMPLRFTAAVWQYLKNRGDFMGYRFRTVKLVFIRAAYDGGLESEY